MEIGFTTRPFRHQPLPAVLERAMVWGLPVLEVMAEPDSLHIDTARFTDSDASLLRDTLERMELRISALGFYCDTTAPGKSAMVQEAACHAIDAAALLGVPYVSMLAGFADRSQSKIETIRTVLPGLFRPILAYGRKRGIAIAIENYYRSVVEGPDTFEALFDAIPDAAFGLNYDPSHLVHQGIDPCVPVRMFPERLFHTHAKDTYIERGDPDDGSPRGEKRWRYTVPGQGDIVWEDYLGTLHEAGYAGALSIEHEDVDCPADTGIPKAAAFLSNYLATCGPEHQ